MEKTDNNLYKEILLHAVDGIIIGSPEGVIVEVNISIQNMLGYDRDELVGKHISEIFPKKTLESRPLRFDRLSSNINSIIFKLQKQLICVWRSKNCVEPLFNG
ncbi:MAG: PAS domain S-box protein [Bacteroidetes bacterium]|nr:PAS domain S-box protein [Bacteroidota bacterium]